MSGKKTVWIVVAVICALAFLSVLTLGIRAVVIRAAETAARGERVVVIRLNGAIEEGQSSLFSAGITPDYVRRQLDRAASDRSIHGVVLRVNSPGGSVAASQEIASMIRQFAKPIVVSMGDMAASGGYYISAPARGIVAQPGTMTGSIGVITQIMNMEGLYEKLGIEVETIKSGRHKDMFSRNLTAEERELLQTLSDEAYEQFVMEVAQGRKIDPEQVRELATGQVYLGSQALELGLVDRLGGIDEAIQYLAEIAGLKNPVPYEFPQPPLFRQFFGTGIKMMQAWDRSMQSEELIMLETVRQGFPFEIRYQVN